MLSRLLSPVATIARSLSTSATPSAFKPHKSAVLYNRNFLSIADLTPQELMTLLDQAGKLKEAYRRREDRDPNFKPLKSSTAALIFQKRSTRTRVSTETITNLLGGSSLFLGQDDIQLGVNETLHDSFKVLSRFNDLLVARVFAHSDIVEMAHHANPTPSSSEAGAPGTRCRVINALSDLHHPLQTLADLLTLQELYGSKDFVNPRTGKKGVVCWVGDGNNILHDLALGCAKVGMKCRIATPAGYEPNSGVMEEVERVFREESMVEGGVYVTNVAADAVKGADVVSTDTWVSMGEEDQKTKKIKEFAGYQVDKALMGNANEGAVFLHCLPRKKEEVSDEVFFDPDVSKVWDEAENRMWTVGAVMMSCLGEGLD